MKTFILGLLGVLLFVNSALSDVILNPENGINIVLKDVPSAGISLTVQRENDIRYLGIIGRTTGLQYNSSSTTNLAFLDFYEVNIQLKITVFVSAEHIKLSLEWSAPVDERLEDCFRLDPHHWFGGPEQKQQYWPVEKLTLKEYSYVTKEDENNAVTEPYWINSVGTLIYVDKRVPLFVDQNNILSNHLCLISDVKKPFSKSRSASELFYDIVITENAKVGHLYAIEHYLGKPIGYPDFRMIQHPVWSTWARFFRPINESIVMGFANEIVDNGFNNSQFEIDDLWEICYGSLTVDTRKFPDMKKTVADLKALGFRVTLWIHPFINENCQPWHSEAKENGYLITTEDGDIFTSWWNNNGSRASHFDFTNPQARSWWIKQILHLKNTYDFDSFKFDAGESGWTPQVPVQTGDIHEHPGHITADYVRAVSEFGSMIEVRSAQRTQDLPVFVRMIDKDTLWTFDNGLPTLVTTLLQMNMNGYPLVLPDMIGGNGYNEKPSKELFIRWLQANTFMPNMQYSFVPWDFDNETIQISHKFTNLHAEYAEKIRDAMIQSVTVGTPANAPIWWLDPTDEDALKNYDEYLLGEDVLVAPVLERGAVTRDIYLPRGVWMYGEDNQSLYMGGSWLRNFSAPLDTLPYFIRLSSN
ncbi:myogenesis-regulating glycosidase-like [Arctopsyche grandis]|uniref:myogenesis-regulating glycosidase-like n=1 Tax=Arctopsyche grandis TaxID=121162 RepID=UPI00406D8228